MISRYASGYLSLGSYYSPTRGVDFKLKTIELDNVTQVRLQVGDDKHDANDDNHQVLTVKCLYTQIWDTPGGEKYIDIICENYLPHTQCIVMVYDVRDRTSLEVVKNWMNFLRWVSMVFLISYKRYYITTIFT